MHALLVTTLDGKQKVIPITNLSSVDPVPGKPGTPEVKAAEAVTAVKGVPPTVDAVTGAVTNPGVPQRLRLSAPTSVVAARKLRASLS